MKSLNITSFCFTFLIALNVTFGCEPDPVRKSKPNLVLPTTTEGPEDKCVANPKAEGCETVVDKKCPTAGEVFDETTQTCKPEAAVVPGAVPGQVPGAAPGTALVTIESLKSGVKFKNTKSTVLIDPTGKSQNCVLKAGSEITLSKNAVASKSNPNLAKVELAAQVPSCKLKEVSVYPRAFAIPLAAAPAAAAPGSTAPGSTSPAGTQ